MTLEEIEGKVTACIYPVAQDATVTQTLPDNPEAFSVHVRGLPAGTPWKGIRVTNSKGIKVQVASALHGFSFIPKAGEFYEVEAVR